MPTVMTLVKLKLHTIKVILGIRRSGFSERREIGLHMNLQPNNSLPVRIKKDNICVITAINNSGNAGLRRKL